MDEVGPEGSVRLAIINETTMFILLNGEMKTMTIEERDQGIRKLKSMWRLKSGIQCLEVSQTRLVPKNKTAHTPKSLELRCQQKEIMGTSQPKNRSIEAVML